MKLFLLALLVSSTSTVFAQDVHDFIDNNEKVIASKEKLKKSINGYCGTSFDQASMPATRIESLLGVEYIALAQIECYGKATLIVEKADNRYAKYSASRVTIDVNYKVMKKGKVKITSIDENEVQQDIFEDLKELVEADNKKIKK